MSELERWSKSQIVIEYVSVHEGIKIYRTVAFAKLIMAALNLSCIHKTVSQLQPLTHRSQLHSSRDVQMPNKRTKFKTKHKFCFAVRFDAVFLRSTEKYLRQLKSALSSPFFNPGRATPFTLQLMRMRLLIILDDQ